MHKSLERFEKQLADTLGNLSAHQTQSRIAPHKWSIQQTVEHLVLTYRATSAAVEARLTRGTPTRATPTLGQRIGQFAVVRCGIFPARRKAPAAVTPPEIPERPLSAAQLTERVHAALVPMEEALGKAHDLFGELPAVNHIVLGPMTVAQWRRFHLVHGRHHLRQIVAARHAEHL